MANDIHARYGGESHVAMAELARQAVALARPMIEHGLGDRRIVGSGFLYLVVMDPAQTPAASVFEEAILYEEAFGDRSRWDADYAAFAREKARLSWINRCDGHVVQHVLPQLLQPGDTVLIGGVYLEGIVVAASGAFPTYDEAFAATIAVCLRALAREARSIDSTGFLSPHAERDKGRPGPPSFSARLSSEAEGPAGPDRPEEA